MADNKVEILVTGRDDAGPAFASADAQAKAFQRTMDQTTRKEIAAHQAVSQAETQHLKTAKLLTDAEAALSGEMDKTSAEADKAAFSFKNLAGMGGGGVSGMGLLVGAIVALAPQVLTLGFGLAGLGIAAFGILDPIKKAAQATGGLQANLHTLDPASRQAAQQILDLGKSYTQFEDALKPTVLRDLNSAIGMVRPLLGEIEPVAKATGNALAQMFNAVGATFRSGEWQQFFNWMASNAGPDMQQLTNILVDTLKALPPLAQALQPVGNALLTVSDDALKAAKPLAQLGLDAQASGDKTFSLARALDQWTVSITNHIPGGKFLNDQITAFQHAASGASSATGQAAGQMGHLGMVTGDLIHPLGTAGGGMGVLAQNTSIAASAARQEASAVSGLTSALAKGLTPLQNYIGATLTQKNDEAALKTALQASGDRIGYKTAQQRASFGAAQTYLQDTLNQAQAAVAAHKSTDSEISSLQNAIGALEAVSGKTGDYNAELSQLKSYLDQLRAEADIVKYVTIITRDVNAGAVPGSGVLPGGQTFHASGGIIGAAAGGARSGLTWVGERGPELVRLPTGSMVYPSGQSMAMAAAGGGGGNTYNLTVNVPPVANPGEVGRVITNAIREFERGSGKGWRK